MVDSYFLGLAVLPTWLVVRNHTPIEHDKNASSGVQDEEQALAQNELSEASNKGGYVVGETVTTK